MILYILKIPILSFIQKGNRKVYKDIAINEGTVSTLIYLDEGYEFYLVYEYLASVIKSRIICKFKYDSDLYMVYSEFFELGEEGGANRFYFKDYVITDQTHEDFTSLGELVPVKYFSRNSSAIVNLYDFQINKIGLIKYNISEEERYIELPIGGKELQYIKSVNITNETKANDMAYYLEQSGAYSEAIFLLEEIIAAFPDRTVAYINLGDAYWGLGEQEKARGAYRTYISQMQEKDKASRIPDVVLLRVKE